MASPSPGNVWRGAAAAKWSSSWVAGDGSKEPKLQLRLSLRELAGAKGADIQWNQSLLDLGVLVCTARAPKCGDCPVRGHCATPGRRMNARA